MCSGPHSELTVAAAVLVLLVIVIISLIVLVIIWKQVHTSTVIFFLVTQNAFTHSLHHKRIHYIQPFIPVLVYSVIYFTLIHSLNS